MAKLKQISVWVNTGEDVVRIDGYSAGHCPSHHYPFTPERAVKICDMAIFLADNGWVFRPFYANSIGWVANKKARP